MDLGDVEDRFAYHVIDDIQRAKMLEIRNMAFSLATLMIANCKDSRELSLAITKLEESVQWVNKGISREKNGGI